MFGSFPTTLLAPSVALLLIVGAFAACDDDSAPVGPDTTTPDSTQPDADSTDTNPPDADANPTETTESDADANTTETAQPDTAPTDTAQPDADTGMIDTTEPDVLAPLALDDLSLTTAEDAPLTVPLAASASATLTFEVVDAPVHGTLSPLAADGSLTYTPDVDYHGEDSFRFRGTNDQGQSADAVVAITVTAVNDAPTVTSVADQAIGADTPTAALAFTLADPDTAADALVVTATSSNLDLVPNDASHIVLEGAGAERTVTLIPATRAHGTAIITVTVDDGEATATTSFTVTVTGDACLYWVNAAGSLWRIDVDGTDAVELVTGISGGSIIATDPVARTVYYGSNSAIVRADSDAANPVTVIANGGFPSGLAVDAVNRKLYWSDFNGKRILRAELDGTEPTPLVTNVDSPSALAFDVASSKGYVISYNNTRLVRFDLDGSNVETVAPNLGGLGVGLAVDPLGGKLYYSTRGTSLYVADLDGTNIAPLVTNQTTVHGIALDAAGGRIYWVDWLAQEVRGATLDGTVVMSFETTSRNLGLAWMPAP